ncbi:carboxypeptidase-like regulatory domain-containing protein [Robertkochia solimangrovi]|uniref:carboxypeptidase-like regulatory domain-containing protein n=1 Tax=Robertkochia solimangrovi TaxID=2213046 RepID=UPI00117CD577|nr:carboxypeptidase-like regulatory domain-containing protein [Robertkochia solimangrovi]TRZ41680.1 hypothetical protein DMZ48_16880 [Robertkochia solimangrovi]
MKYHYLLLFVLCFQSAVLFGQKVTGKVVDEDSNPIPYATIQLGENYGVVSNMEGEFTIYVTDQPEAVIVKISFMGYETLEIPVDQFTDGTYTLKISAEELDEVLVTNRNLSPEEIIEKMMEAAPDNYLGKEIQQTFFIRNQDEQKLLDFSFEIDKATELSRSQLKDLNAKIEDMAGRLKGKSFNFFSEYYGRYARKEDSSKIHIEKAVVLKDKEREISTDAITKNLINVIRTHLEPDATYKVKTGLFKVEDSLKTDEIFDEDIDSTKGKTKYLKYMVSGQNRFYNNFYKDKDLDFLDKTRRYRYTLEGYTNIDEELVYIISFKPDRGSSKFFGKLYINVFDFALMRMDYEMLEDEHLSNVNLKFLLGVKFTENKMKVTSVFRKNEEGKYALKFGRRTNGFYAYISRPLKFIKNKEDRSDDRKVMKFDFMVEMDNLSTIEIYCPDNSAMKEVDYAAMENQKRYEPIEISKYDPQIWEGYNIIAPIEAIKSY